LVGEECLKAKLGVKAMVNPLEILTELGKKEDLGHFDSEP
jgi:hypothetical protein